MIFRRLKHEPFCWYDFDDTFNEIETRVNDFEEEETVKTKK
jgi:hypothetical protein